LQVSAVFEYGMIFAARKVSKSGKLPQVWGGKEKLLSWAAAFVFFFLVVLLDRYVL
jgi:hypothetical protein